MMAAIAHLYLGSMTFFAAREARAASGSASRLSSPQLRLSGWDLKSYRYPVEANLRYSVPYSYEEHRTRMFVIIHFANGHDFASRL